MEKSPVSPQSPPSPPATAGFAHFDFIRPLGQGGFGEVVEAWDGKLRRKVAIKRLRGAAMLRHPSLLLNEARLAASLPHPAFVKIYSIEEDRDSHAIVMELIPGTTLSVLIANGASSLDDALDIMWQLAGAMHEAHQAGLVHGDLKPSNLMREPSGKVRILDLGLAFHDDAQATMSVIELERQGTIAYMAPECLLGTAPGRQSDIYAMGVIFYELVTGNRPFGTLNGLALAAAQMQGSSAQWLFPDAVPPDVCALIRDMTVRQPERRLADTQQLLARLQSLRVRAPDTPAPPETRRPRFRWRALAGATLVLSCLAGIGWLVERRPPDAVMAFSTAAAIRSGLDKLRQFDRPAQLAAATREFEAILARYPDHAAAVAAMSLTHSFRYANDRQDDLWRHRAAEYAQRALALDQRLALSHVAHAWTLANDGRTEQALAACEQALALEPGGFFATLGKISFLTRLRRYDEAQRLAEQALRQFPLERSFTDALGSVHYEQGRYAAAEQAFRHSIRLQPDSVLAYANLNATLLKLNRGDEALQVLQRGLEIAPHALLYTNLGNALFQRGDYAGARDAFQRAVTRPVGNPDSYLGWANLADTLLWIPGGKAEAAQAFGTALRLLAPELQRRPQDAVLLSRMSLYAARVGDATTSTILLRRAIAAAPEDAMVHFRAGLACELLNDRDEALAQLTVAKALGYPASAIDAEPDLASLRRDRRYRRQ